jgi:hypothetical protein
MTVQDLATQALIKIGVARGGDAPASEDLNFVCDVLNRVLDDLNAERGAVYADVFSTYVLTANLNPHTIGPTGTFVVTQRPVSIEGANLILNTSTPAIRQPITLRDRAWWLDERVRTLTSSNPTDLYYQTAWPNGTLNFWPVPTTAYSVELLSRIVLASVALTDTFTLPPGYQSFLTLRLAESIAEDFGQPVTPQLQRDVARATARVYANNDRTPRIATRDHGMPSGRRSGFNYLTRRIE